MGTNEWGGVSIKPNLVSKFEKVLSQQLAFEFTSLGLGMLMTRLIGKYKANPTQAVMQACIAEVGAFVEKYGAVLENDLARLAAK